MIRKILVPLDGSNFAEQALPYAIDIARKFEAQLTLIWVLNPMVIMSDFGAVTYQNLVSLEQDEAQAYLLAKQSEIQKDGISVKTQILEGAVADAIIDTACQGDNDLIVMSTHGRSGLSRWVYGSVATKVLQQAPCPVFLVRPKPS